MHYKIGVTVHTVWILQSPLTPRFFMSADNHSLSRRPRHAKLSAYLGEFQATDDVAVARGGTHGGLLLIRVTRY